MKEELLPKPLPILVLAVGNADGIADAGIRPANPGAFPPSAIIATLNTVKAVVDTEHSEIRISNAEIFPPIPTVIILDAFGNSYLPGYLLAGPPPPIDYDPVTLQSANPTLAVVKTDGTPYPGATALVSGNDIIIRFTLSSITAENGDPILKIIAGSGIAQINLKIRAMVATSLRNRFVPILGVSDTPITLNFADQNGTFIVPVTNGPAFDVYVVASGGTTSEGTNFTKTLSDVNPKETFTAEIYDTDPDKIMTITADGYDANAGSTTLILDFSAGPDMQPPAIGAITPGDCSLSIAISDNKAVNLAASTIKVKIGDTGQDITATLTRADTNDNTPSGTINFSGVPTGSYVLEIDARDQNGNVTSDVRTATVSLCSTGVPTCAEINPAFGSEGQTLDLTIGGVYTSFNSSSAVSFSYPGIITNSVTVNSPTSIKVNITILYSAPEGKCDVTVTTGAEVVTCSQGFEVKPAPCDTNGYLTIDAVSLDLLAGELILPLKLQTTDSIDSLSTEIKFTGGLIPMGCYLSPALTNLDKMIDCTWVQGDPGNTNDDYYQVSIYGMTTDAIPNGIVGSVKFQIPQGLCGTLLPFELTSRGAKTDSAATPVCFNKYTGNVPITLPGDRNVNFTTDIDEVQWAINMLIGYYSPVDPIVDTDNDGAVTLVEVQNVIDSHMKRIPCQ